MLLLMKRAVLCKVEQFYSFATLGKVRPVSTVKGEACFSKPVIPVATMENLFAQVTKNVNYSPEL